jgi:uncharacterized protein GlcG (DUF336 family)
MIPALTADDARQMMDAAVTAAHSLNVAVTIAIVDDGGFLMSLVRLDGTGRMTAEVATGKARTAALMRRPSAVVEKMVEEHPPYVRLPHILPMAGGLPLMHAGVCVGAVGVTGAPAESDVAIAQAAVDALAKVARESDGQAAGAA